MATMNEKRQRFIRYYKEVNNAQEVVMARCGRPG